MTVQLNEEQQVTLCKNFNPKTKELLLEQAKNGLICDKVQRRLFRMPDNEGMEILKEQAQNGELCNCVQLKLFSIPGGLDLLMMQAERGELTRAAELKVFKLPNAKNFLLAQAKKGNLQNTKWVFSFSFADEIILEQAKNGWIYSDIQKKILSLPNAEEIFLEMAKKGNLGGYRDNGWLQKRAFLFSRANEILLEQARNGDIDDEVQSDVVKLPSAEEIMLAQAERGSLCNEEAQVQALDFNCGKKIAFALLKAGVLCGKAQIKAVELGYFTA